MAALDKIDFGAWLLDLVKAFEKVLHHILVAIAIELGYPLPLLRLCLASYRLKRSIAIEGVFSKTVTATRGITAGSGTAATELKLLLLPLMRMLESQWANVLVAKVYVDDLTLIVRGLQAEVVNKPADIMNLVIEHLEGTLKMQVSKEKSNVVASKPSLALAVAERVDNKVAKAANHAKILGRRHGWRGTQVHVPTPLQNVAVHGKGPEVQCPERSWSERPPDGSRGRGAFCPSRGGMHRG